MLQQQAAKKDCFLLYWLKSGQVSSRRSLTFDTDKKTFQTSFYSPFKTTVVQSAELTIYPWSWLNSMSYPTII